MRRSNWYYIVIAVFMTVALTYTRLLYKIKGVKLTATVKDYIRPQDVYFAILEFEYQGQVINMKSSRGFKKIKYEVGTQLDISYIPGNSKGVMIVSDYSDLIYLAIFIACGLVIGAGMIWG